MLLLLSSNLWLTQSRSIDDFELLHVTLLTVPGPQPINISEFGFEFQHDTLGHEITPNGMKMHYILGHLLRENYWSRLKETVRKSDLLIMGCASSTFGTDQSSDALLAGFCQESEVEGVIKVTEFSTSPGKSAFPPFFGLKSAFQTPLSLQYLQRPIHTWSMRHNDIGSEQSYPNSCSEFVKWFEGVKQHNLEHLEEGLDLSEILNKLHQTGISKEQLLHKRNSLLAGLAALYEQAHAYKNYFGQLPTQLSEELFVSLRKFADIWFSSRVLPAGRRNTPFRASTHDLGLELLRGFAQMIPSGSKSVGMEFLTSMGRSNIFRTMVLSREALHSITTNLYMSSTDCLLSRLRGKTPEGMCLDPPSYASNWVIEIYTPKSGSGGVFARARYDGQLINVCNLDTAISKELLCPYALFRDVLKNTLLIQPTLERSDTFLREWQFTEDTSN